MSKTPKPTLEEENNEDQQGLEPPVNPDEGMPLVPDDERVANAPS
jgi:hypothetical protein